MTYASKMIGDLGWTVITPYHLQQHIQTCWEIEQKKNKWEEVSIVEDQKVHKAYLGN